MCCEKIKASYKSKCNNKYKRLTKNITRRDRFIVLKCLKTFNKICYFFIILWILGFAYF